VWNANRLPLKVVLLVGAILFLLSQVDTVRFWRGVDDALSSGDEHSGLTRDEAVARAVARLEDFYDRHGRTAELARGGFTVVHAERTTGLVRAWCFRCDHWLIELRHRSDNRPAEKFCLAVTEDFAGFSNACDRWAAPAKPPPTALVASARPTPVATASPGVVLFQRRHRGFADLYIVDVAGGGLRRLTSTAEHEFSPAWSPDGAHIAFVRNLGGSESDIFVMRADGSEVVRLTDSPGPDEEPAWLPDGRLAFRSVRDGIGSTYVLDSKKPSVAPRRLLVETSSAEWAPSGRVIAFSATINFGFDVWLTDADAKGRWNLTSTLSEDAYAPRWSPDGTRIAFVTQRAIYVMRADGGGRRAIVSRPHEFGIAWSPDGTRIAWIGALDGGGIRVTSLATGETVALTHHPGDQAPDWR
jgi:dipeptidyl aminopeptidase/acylaminoacyl peptidase